MSEPLTDDEIADLRAILAEREVVWRRNYAALKHESETPMRGHDPDGACCRDAARGVQR